ncbi:pollen receptor-like kinase 3 [Rutidosis leptorrhynchoides]|uniref:pollen receptor-like kinase 3 n=1 Tax=Rutidosis leptorrhynchoides TaxID=125765 RepID=UPI003A98DA82
MAVVPCCHHHHYHIMLFLSALLLLNISLHTFSQNISSSSSATALLKFKNSLSKSDSLTNWKQQKDDQSSSPCDRNNMWVGIVCNYMDDTITSINLANMGLQGRPNVADLAPLEDLESISFQNNSLSGPIPAFNLLPNLKIIYASKNQFSGVIPSNFFQPLGSLKRLWLSDNKFSGPIPKSLGDLSYLKELHLENNEFSGPIPDEFSELEVLDVLVVSNNRLDGPIPRPLNRFDKEAFENNPDLCGLKASKKCPTDDSQSNLTKKLIIAAVVTTLLLLIMTLKDKRKEENMRILRKENNYDHEAVVTIPNMSRKNSSSSRKGYSSLKNKMRSRSSPKKGGGGGPVGELVMLVNEEKGDSVFELNDLMKASAEVLGNGGLGSAYKATLGNGVSVVLKKMKEMNHPMTKHVFDTEMKKLGRLKHDNILTPLAYHFRKDDKFLVSEYVPKGSLHNVLHGDSEMKRSELNWTNRLKMIKGVVRGMGYLHSELASNELPHGNLKSSNILIGKNYEPLLNDYALHPLINSTPTAELMFAYSSPEALHDRQQLLSHKTDVYCLGIVILEIVTGKYPSQYLMNNNNSNSNSNNYYKQKGESGTDVVQWLRSALDENRESELIDPDLLPNPCVPQIQKLLHIGAACTETDVDTRIHMKEAVTRIDDL